MRRAFKRHFLHADKKLKFCRRFKALTTIMGNKRIIVKPNGDRRKVCERTQKVIVETNFCWCGNKHCHEGFRMISQKALCKVRRFREKFRPIFDMDRDEE
jgi:acetone carboxylase gamma subunit